MSTPKPVEAPLSPPVLPAVSKADKMVYVWLTDYVADTAGIVYQKSGELAYNVTPDMVSSIREFQMYIHMCGPMHWSTRQ